MVVEPLGLRDRPSWAASWTPFRVLFSRHHLPARSPFSPLQPILSFPSCFVFERETLLSSEPRLFG